MANRGRPSATWHNPAARVTTIVSKFTQSRLPHGSDGFTVLEIMVAAAVIAVALVALLSAMTYSTAGVEAGRQQSTAVFLAEQRLEQIRGTKYADVVSAVSKGYGALGDFPNAPRFRGTVTITNDPGGTAKTKLVEVSVFYRPVTAMGVLAEREMRVSTLVADR